MPAACLFDLDGLLLDTEPLHAQAWRQAADHFGLTLEADQLLSLRGRRRLDCALQVLTWLGDAGLMVPGTDDLLAIRQPIAEQLLAQAQPIAGAEELLLRCRSLGLPLALVTSSSRAAVASKISPHPWIAAVDLQVSGDDPELERGKPHPDPFLLAARRLGVNATCCWAFEDSPAGARAAASAGCLVHVLVPPELKLGDPRGHYGIEALYLHSLRQVTFPATGLETLAVNQ